MAKRATVPSGPRATIEPPVISTGCRQPAWTMSATTIDAPASAGSAAAVQGCTDTDRLAATPASAAAGLGCE